MDSLFTWYIKQITLINEMADVLKWILSILLYKYQILNSKNIWTQAFAYFKEVEGIIAKSVLLALYTSK